MSDAPSRLAAVEAFQHLTRDEIARLEETARLQPVARGQALVRQGDVAEALYIVISGRFRVHRDDRPDVVAEIGVGSPIGEIAFLAGGKRTATVTAERDSLVLELKREDFDRLAEGSPRIWQTIASQLARRLAATTAGPAGTASAVPRTITVARAGGGPASPGFLSTFAADLKAAFRLGVRIIVLDSEAARAGLPVGVSLESSEATQWFNALESRFEHVVYIADDELTEWTKKALRQADLVLCIGRATEGTSREPNLMELFAERLHQKNTARLVLAHDSSPPYHGTNQWLDSRPWVRMHHHLAPRTNAPESTTDLSGDRYAADMRRIARFIRNEAIGLVACGGGAFSAAHIGVFEALANAGLEFDVIGGTSGGAAMGAALALGVAPAEIEIRTHKIFVERKAMRRWTWPRYSLLDHTELDRSLSEHFTAVGIEDLEIAYFAVATNLSRNVAHCIDRGPLWQAIRASAAIPALLPPVFTADGEMLVDGSLVENVPLRTMMALKSGPNVVIDFHTENSDRCTVDSSMLPARGDLVLRMLSLRGKAMLPHVPGPQSVLLRSLMLNRPDYSASLGTPDILLRPTIPAGIGHLDWHRHAELRQAAREYATREIERLRGEGHALLQTPPPGQSTPRDDIALSVRTTK